MKIQCVTIQMKATKQYFAVSWCSGNVRYAIWSMLIFPTENKDPDAAEVLISCQTATGCRVLGKWKWKKTKTKVNFVEITDQDMPLCKLIAETNFVSQVAKSEKLDLKRAVFSFFYFSFFKVSWTNYTKVLLCNLSVVGYPMCVVLSSLYIIYKIYF